jgi:AcrR family transcriptional regulator
MKRVMGPTMTRKQREIERREELILETARSMLLERGYLGLTMDRIAEAIEYSKGTVYQHFRSKEDLIVALAAQANERRADFFEKAATFRGRPRERILAIGVALDLFRRLYPSWLRAEQIIHASSVHEKADRERMQAIYAHENRCSSVSLGIVRDAIAHGDLAPEKSPEVVVFGLWTMTYGAHFLDSADMPTEQKFGDTVAALRTNQQILLDGHGWRPLSREWDYEATEQRILDEVFADEVARLGRP